MYCYTLLWTCIIHYYGHALLLLVDFMLIENIYETFNSHYTCLGVFIANHLLFTILYSIFIWPKPSLIILYYPIAVNLIHSIAPYPFTRPSDCQHSRHSAHSVHSVHSQHSVHSIH